MLNECRSAAGTFDQAKGVAHAVEGSRNAKLSSSELASVSSPAELIRTSDIALYEAKRCGRNQIVAAPKTASDLDRVSEKTRIENF